MIIDISTNQNDCRGKRAELNVYDDTINDLSLPVDCPGVVYLKKPGNISKDLMDKLIEFENSEEGQRLIKKILENYLPDECSGLHSLDFGDMEYAINASHKDQDGVAVIDDFRIRSINIDIKESER